jgi:hypothetical protein
MIREVVVLSALADILIELSSTRYFKRGEDKFAEDRYPVCRDNGSTDRQIRHLAVLNLHYRHSRWCRRYCS